MQANEYPRWEMVVHAGARGPDFRLAIAEAIKTAEMRDLMIAGPISLSWVALFPRPKSHYRAGQLKEAIPTRHVSAPSITSISNTIITILHANNVIRNCKQATEIFGSKLYNAASAQVSIVIREI